jgi:4-hydroxybenzoate polyprenyltransferase
MLWLIIVVLAVLWLIGLLAEIGGDLIHLVLVVAAIILIYRFVTGKRSM